MVILNGLISASNAQNEPNPVLPDTLFLSLGNTIEIYNDNVAFVQLDNSAYAFDWEYDVGHSDSIKWYWTSDRLGSFRLKFNCYFEGSLVDVATTIVEVLPKISGGTYNLLSIGNSITAGGFAYQFDEIQNDLDVQLNAIGTQGGDIKHEGHPGWTYQRFLSPESPFYFGTIDFNQYLSANELPIPDIIKLSLGPNEAFLSNSMTYIKQTVDDMLAEIREDFSEALILIALPTLCENSGVGWTSVYGDLSKYEYYQLRLRELWDYILTTYSGAGGSQLIQVTYDGLCIDRNDGYRKNSSGVHIDGVHPNEVGNRQLSRGFSNVLNRYLQTITTPTDTEPPSTPDGIQLISATNNSLSISWNTSTDNVAVSEYKIFVNSDFTASTASNSYTISGLTAESSYSITISAIDASSNESARSNPFTASTEADPDIQPPSVPVGLEATEVTHNLVTLEWQPSTDNVAVVGYQVFLDDELAGSSQNEFFTFTGLDPGRRYLLSVTSFDEALNESARSLALSVRTLEELDTIPPTIPQNLEIIDVTTSNIHLKWDASIDYKTGVFGYKIYSNGILRDSTDTNTSNLSGLAEGLEYVLTVTAYDFANNESMASDPINATTLVTDTSVNPTFPNLSIINSHQSDDGARMTTKLSSFGYTELEKFGMLVKEDNMHPEDAWLIETEPEDYEIDHQGRVTMNLQALYDFSEDHDPYTIPDISNSGSPIHLKISSIFNTTWLRGQGLKIVDSTPIAAETGSISLIDSLKATDEITIEAWLKPTANSLNGSANLLKLSSDQGQQILAINQIANSVYYNYEVERQTTIYDSITNHSIRTSRNFQNPNLHHIVYTKNHFGDEKIYVNGIILYEGTQLGNFDSWKDILLELAIQPMEQHRWSGTLFLVAIYNRSLIEDEIRTNFETGIGEVFYRTELNSLSQGNQYFLKPVAFTNQGIVYGDSISITMMDKDPSLNDSIQINLYPNPSDGNFTLKFEDLTYSSDKAFLFISDLSGQIVYSKEIFLHEILYIHEEQLNLKGVLSNGFYSLMVIIGPNSSATKLLIQN